MTLADVNKLPLGLYFIEWHHGGGGVAAIGMNSSGVRWIAPTNWTFPSAWTDESWHEVKSARLITTQAQELAKMKGGSVSIPRITTCEQLLKWFGNQEYTPTSKRSQWEVCVDSGCCYLRYVGQELPDDEPPTPIELNLEDGSSLIVELMGMVGIPASRA